MTYNRAGRGRRVGFTLIEVLIVITIIALLASLALVAASGVMRRAKDAATIQEIRQFDSAIGNFEQAYNVPYLPSRIWLDESGQYTGNGTVPLKTATALSPAQQSALEQDSRQYLERVFGRSLTFPIDWNGDGTPGNSNVILEGHQTFAFFLGGIAETATDPADGRLKATRLKGFSTNPTNPSNFNAGVKGPFVDAGEFNLGRFFFTPTNPTQNPNGVVPAWGNFAQYPGFKDRYGELPYLYFSSYKAQNGYNRYYVSDCESLGGRPYYEQGQSALDANGNTRLDGRYLKPQTYQLVSGGRNLQFGSLTNYLAIPGANPPTAWPQPWTPATAALVYPNVAAGADDLSNFYDNALGSAQ